MNQQTDRQTVESCRTTDETPRATDDHLFCDAVGGHLILSSADLVGITVLLYLCSASPLLCPTRLSPQEQEEAAPILISSLAEDTVPHSVAIFYNTPYGVVNNRVAIKYGSKKGFSIGTHSKQTPEIMRAQESPNFQVPGPVQLSLTSSPLGPYPFQYSHTLPPGCDWILVFPMSEYRFHDQNSHCCWKGEIWPR